MYDVAISPPDDLARFREVARRLIASGAPPASVLWRDGEDRQLFGTALPASAAPLSVPSAFVPVAEAAICHRDGERFGLLYEALWRLVRGERNLFQDTADPLVHRLSRMAKAVRREIHKMHAFVRFRRVETAEGERFVAWFEPEHHILRRAAPFFVCRFAAMRWSILTPAGSLHWDGAQLACTAPRAEGAGASRRSPRGVVAGLLPGHIQSGACECRRHARGDAEEVLAQSAGDRGDCAPARRRARAHPDDAGRCASGAAQARQNSRAAVRAWRYLGLITVHPSFLLRLPEAAARTREHARFIDDLRQVAELVPAIRLAA